MCLAIPSRIIAVEGSKATVELAGVTRRVDVSLIPSVHVGDYVLVHTGYAITVVDEEEARETLQLLETLSKSHEVS
ncbi:MAG: HypC/HybG/HupF family hydrogenase formation chaperone [Deltaproteobacteria bacterium]|nr:HypC/HybG/HupF family hydrogenase formation chaperone [Deltaproteobacteria bacterium]